MRRGPIEATRHVSHSLIHGLGSSTAMRRGPIEAISPRRFYCDARGRSSTAMRRGPIEATLALNVAAPPTKVIHGHAPWPH